jgi:hypothetical protein
MADPPRVPKCHAASVVADTSCSSSPIDVSGSDHGVHDRGSKASSSILWQAKRILVSWHLVSRYLGFFELARAEAQKQKQVVLYTKKSVLAIRVARFDFIERGIRAVAFTPLQSRSEPSQKQKALRELLTNQNATKRVRSSVYNCKVCDVSLYKEYPLLEGIF